MGRHITQFKVQLGYFLAHTHERRRTARVDPGSMMSCQLSHNKARWHTISDTVRGIVGATDYVLFLAQIHSGGILIKLARSGELVY